MKIKYILDTSALIENPRVYLDFPESDVIIPMVVLEELDKLKKEKDQTGMNARICIREFDKLSEKNNLSIGITLEKNITLFVDSEFLDLNDPKYIGLGDKSYGDTRILACVYKHWLEDARHGVCLVSNDFNLRLKGRSLGIDCFGAENEKKSRESTELYSGNQTIIDAEAGLELQQHGYLDLNDWKFDLYENEYIMFVDDSENLISFGRKIGDKLKLVKKQHPYGIGPKNKQQILAIDCLMDKSLDLVTLAGPAGTGKSFLALASALELVLNRKEYDKIIIFKPMVSVGDGVGYLKGTLAEKLEPWFDSVNDSLEILLSGKSNRKDQWKKDLDMLITKGIISMECMSFLRGRSVPRTLIISEESQNGDISQLKTLITRLGEGSKIILIGDTEQIDTKFLDKNNNGLSTIISKFKEYDLSAHVTLNIGERSKLATLASQIL